MTTVPPRVRSLGSLRRAGVGGSVVALALLLCALPPALGSPVNVGAPAYTPTSWTNGEVVCSFAASVPSVTVSPLASPASGMRIGLGALTQDSLTGVLATASLTNASWYATNLSTPDQYSLVYTSTVYVSVLGLLSVPTATVSVGISLADPSDGSSALADHVAVSLSVSGWPWVSGLSNLELTLSISAAGANHLESIGTSGTSIGSMSNASGGAVAYVSMPGIANTSNSSGPVGTIPVVSAPSGLTPESGALTISFGSAAAGSKTVSYDPEIIVVIPGHGPVQIPLAYLAAAGGAAVLASLAIAGVTRRVRRSPTDLEYVEEET
jgi:hypothetical protein